MGWALDEQVVEQRLEVDRLALDEARLLAVREQQEVLGEARHAVDLGGDQTRHAADLVLIGVGVAREHLELAADCGERRAQLVGGVGRERLLAREGLLEAVEHVVEGVREDPRLVDRTARVDSRGEIAGIDARGDLRHAPQRPGEPSWRAEADQQRERERDRAADREAAQDPVEGVVDRRERLADGDPPDLAGAGAVDARDEHAQGADVGRVRVASPGGACSSSRASVVSSRRRSRRCRSSSGSRPKTSGSLV